MGKKGRCRSRTMRTVMKERFPVGRLAQRRKQMQEEFITHSCTYQNERKQQEKIKVKEFIHSLFSVHSKCINSLWFFCPQLILCHTIHCFNNPIIHLIYHPPSPPPKKKKERKSSSKFVLGICNPLKELKQCLCKTLGG